MEFSGNKTGRTLVRPAENTRNEIGSVQRGRIRIDDIVHILFRRDDPFRTHDRTVSPSGFAFVGHAAGQRDRERGNVDHADNLALDATKSKIAEVVLGTEKAQSKDPRQAYGAMQDIMTALIRDFRDLPGRHVYFSAKVEKQQNELGQLLHSPSMPGQKLGQMLPYFFDEVLALRVGQNENGETMRTLQCATDGIWTAKDRSGRLDMWEPADLGRIIEKIGGQDNE